MAYPRKHLRAGEARADYIVSGDPDLLSLGTHEGIAINSPRTFLTVLARLK